MVSGFVDAYVSDSGGGGGGTTDHAALSNLDYASAGHTGFEPALTTGNLTATSPILLDQTRQVIGGAAVVSFDSAYMPRERLTAARTYYVRKDGNDSNTGLVDSAAGAFLTIQKAVNVYQALDCNGYNVTIQVGAGTYTDAIVITTRTGSGSLYLTGDKATPANVALTVSTSDTIQVSGHPTGSSVYIEGFTLRTTHTGSACIHAMACSVVLFGNIVFGASTYYHLFSETSAELSFINACTISGSATISIVLGYGGFVRSRGSGSITVTLTGTPAFSGFFCYIGTTSVYHSNNNEPAYITFSGSATGTRYLCESNGVANLNAAGPNYFPGNVAGSTSTGGQYL
jgi:hypothetical protein